MTLPTAGFSPDDEAQPPAPGQPAQPSPSVARPSLHAAGAASDVCPICGGTGYVLADVPVGHPDFGKALPCRCREKDRVQRRLAALHTISNVDTLVRLTFETFIAEPTHLTPDKAYNLRRAPRNLHLLCRVARRMAPAQRRLWLRQDALGRIHRQCPPSHGRTRALYGCARPARPPARAFNPHSTITYDNLFEQVRTAPLLILDDLGAQSSTPWAQEKLFQLLNYRYNARLATVITTNQRLEDLDPRIRSRLMDPSIVSHYTILAPDFRSGQNPGQSELSTLGFHREQTLENFDIRRPDLSGEDQITLRTVYAVCEEFAREPRGWLTLSGRSGAGKTHLAAAIANYVVSTSPNSVMFVVVPDLLDHLRAAFSPNANTSYDRRFDEIKRVPCLVLDDLGTESATPWAREKLFQLLNYRYNALLPTVITTTQAANEIEPWLRTRMLDVTRGQFCALDIPSYRRTRLKDEPSVAPRPKGRGRQQRD